MQASTSSLTVSAGLVEFSEDVVFGGTKKIGTPPASGGTAARESLTSTYGFADAEFISAGDIRFLGSSVANQKGFVQSSGDLTFDAGQLLPATEKTTNVYAGLNEAAAGSVSSLAGGTLTVLQNGSGGAQAISVGGTLALVAETILVDGTVRAPEGSIRLGYDDGFDVLPNDAATVTRSVVLEPGSVTSVSLAGETIPFGGTVDGVNYLVAGVTAPLFTPVVEIDSEAVTAKAGARRSICAVAER